MHIVQQCCCDLLDRVTSILSSLILSKAVIFGGCENGQLVKINEFFGKLLRVLFFNLRLRCLSIL